MFKIYLKNESIYLYHKTRKQIVRANLIYNNSYSNFNQIILFEFFFVYFLF